MEPRRTVLDTSFFLGGRPMPPAASCAVPETVLEEFERPDRARRGIENAVAAGLAVMRPEEASRARVREAAARTGDLAKMSPADVDVLALALELGGGAVSDDYRIQNVGRALAVPVQGSDQRGIREAWEWVPRCTGCRRLLEPPAEGAARRPTAWPPAECPVCGSPVKLVKRP